MRTGESEGFTPFLHTVGCPQAPARPGCSLPGGHVGNCRWDVDTGHMGRWELALALALVPLVAPAPTAALALVQHQPHHEYQLRHQLQHRYEPLALWPPPRSTWWPACQLAQLISA